MGFEKVAGKKLWWSNLIRLHKEYICSFVYSEFVGKFFIVVLLELQREAIGTKRFFVWRKRPLFKIILRLLFS